MVMNEEKKLIIIVSNSIFREIASNVGRTKLMVWFANAGNTKAVTAGKEKMKRKERFDQAHRLGSTFHPSLIHSYSTGFGLC